MHGILHLLGYDHEEDAGKAEMWARQERYSGVSAAVNWLWVLVGVLVILGSLLAMAEASLTRMTRVRALALEEEGRRNAALLVRLETDPPRYLNSIYLTVMIVQNGSAILVAILAESTFGGLGITIASLVFTLLYFVLVEAMSKTFGDPALGPRGARALAARVLPRTAPRLARPAP